MKNLIERLIPIDELIATVRRFPLSVICAICIFILVFIGIHDLIDMQDDGILRVCCIFGCLYFWFGIARLMSESQDLTLKASILVTLIPAIGIAALLWFSQVWGMHLLFLMPALLLTLMFAAYLKGGDDVSVWFFNRQMWFGVAVSYIALILFAGGLSTALFAIEKLFNIDIKDDFYGDIWAFSGFVLGPVYALSWVPKRFEFSNEDCIDPPGLKFIANWISAPMVFMYLLILYAYFGKVIIDQSLPNGILAYLISGFVGAGVLTYLVSWPLQESGSAQLRLLHKIFFPVLIIPVGFHFFAIWERISAYGMTEQRYFLLLTAMWFAILAIGNIFSKMPIKAIPASLAILFIFASFGPWGAVSVSGQSQLLRLERLLENNDLIKDGKVQKAQGDIPFEDRMSISSIVEYLCNTQRDELVYRFFEPSEQKTKRCYANNLVKDQLGFDYTYRYSSKDNAEFIQIWNNANLNSVQDIAPYRFFIKSSNICKGVQCAGDDPQKLEVYFDQERTSLQFKRAGNVVLEENIRDFIIDNKSYKESTEPLSLELENDVLMLRMDILSVYGQIKDNRPIINSMTYDLFYRFKDESQ